jgi:predicted  nucleic acid-binding Zn-ribbon protein
MFACLECGRKFRTANAAYKASIHGCPKCGGVDIDLDTTEGRHAVISRDAPMQPHIDPQTRTADRQV